LHHGKIEVESEHGMGSTFTILLPLGKEHLTPDQIIKDPQLADDPDLSSQESQPDIPYTPYTPDTQKEQLNSDAEDVAKTETEPPILLIVEDNADMRAYIREQFETEYRIIEAVDGLEGFNKSIEHIPDIIISDVMMPKMDGNEFCAKLKNDERTCHFPLILLTARASSESRIESLETGADDFITKPFDGGELSIRVKNLVEQRKRIRRVLEGKFRKSYSGPRIDFADSGISSMDEQFMQKLVTLLKEHHTNPELNITEFSRLIGQSRAQLNRKVKALTGQSTAEFIRTYRLNRAAELIKKKSGTVAEIAYDVGFNNPSYFTECFKQYYGQLPSEFNDQS